MFHVKQRFFCGFMEFWARKLLGVGRPFAVSSAPERSTQANMRSASRQKMARPVKPRTVSERALREEEEHDGVRRTAGGEVLRANLDDLTRGRLRVPCSREVGHRRYRGAATASRHAFGRLLRKGPIAEPREKRAE